jgi:glycosyltransferase involved in cell wall biosynthesis
MKLSVVMPAFNERSTIAEIVRRVCAVPIDKEIIIVDDGSTDGTLKELAKLGLVGQNAAADGPGPAGVVNELRLLLHEVNQGKGASIRDGIAAATGGVIIVQDADLEYDPADYPKLLQPIFDGKADVVYGSRFTGSPRRVLYFWHHVGNWLLTTLSNMLTDLNLTDMETCYKAFRAEILKGLPLRSNRFGIEPELTAKVARMRARIYEVPISYAGRSYLEGKKIGWKDGVAAIWTMLRYAVVDDLENADAAYRTLQRVGHLRRYNAWLWSRIAPFVGERILEVGAGTGNMTRYLSSHELVVATDVDPKYVTLLRNTFANDPHVEVRSFDLEADDSAASVGGRFDTVLCLNVLEHVEDDVRALRRIRDVLEESGRLVLVVPALQALHGEIDRAIGHCRRYELVQLQETLAAADFTLEHSTLFNVAGAVGWYVNSRLLRRRTVPRFQARINDWLVPLLRFEDHFQLGIGLSILAVARRRNGATAGVKQGSMPGEAAADAEETAASQARA